MINQLRYFYLFVLVVIAYMCVDVHHLYARWLAPPPPPPLTNEHLRQLQELVGDRGYRVLSLGGSVTAGMNLIHPTHSYPYLVGLSSSPDKVTNVAISDGVTGGADYISLCLDSLLSGVQGEKDYDVILLEFSLDGHDEMELLLKRLRHRFPNAIIIYVHLYSLYTDIADMEGLTPAQREQQQKLHGGDANADDIGEYHWSYGEQMNLAVYRKISDMAKQYNVYMYGLPKTSHVLDSAPFFAPDHHHLSQDGHNTVAEGILSILKDVPAPHHLTTPLISSTTTKQSRGIIRGSSKQPSSDGEQCFSWYSSGKIPLKRTGSTEMVPFAIQGDTSQKYALECSTSCSLTLTNNANTTLPLYFFFMTKSGDYPIVEVQLNGDVTIVDPTTKVERDVVSSKIVGRVAPGINEVEVRSITDAVLPFRVTGVVFCEMCERFRDD